ncbi:GLoBin related [Ditylenchus destructor]|uniref:GLoBin related n=1 Tax=Ditylenchus destructor TaxID=166010 RepID=A0AAD4N945_9BILA|nr:GLoBin related [Ditylenchus destructor]
MGNQNSGGVATVSPASKQASIRRKTSCGSGRFNSHLSVGDGESGEQVKLSHSMYEFDGTSSLQRRRRQSAVSSGTSNSGSDKKRSTVARLNSSGPQLVGGVGYGDTHEDQYLNGFNAPSASKTASASGFMTRQRSVRKSEVQGHPISASGREIIQFCFENAHPDIGFRICNRLFEKRVDYQRFVHQLGRDKWPQMTQLLKDFLDKAVAKIDNLEAVERLARKYGEDHVNLKNYGFKPDFWVTLADAITVEAVILDQATHQPTDTVTAWSLFVSILFSSIRDGYYTALRAQRMSTRKKSIRQGAEENVVATLNNAGATTGLPLSPLALSSTSGTAMRKDSTGSNRLDTPKDPSPSPGSCTPVRQMSPTFFGRNDGGGELSRSSSNTAVGLNNSGKRRVSAVGDLLSPT